MKMHPWSVDGAKSHPGRLQEASPKPPVYHFYEFVKYYLGLWGAVWAPWVIADRSQVALLRLGWHFDPQKMGSGSGSWTNLKANEKSMRKWVNNPYVVHVKFRKILSEFIHAEPWFILYSSSKNAIFKNWSLSKIDEKSKKIDAESMLQKVEKSIHDNLSKNELWGDLGPLILRLLLFCRGAKKSWKFGTSQEAQQNEKNSP